MTSSAAPPVRLGDDLPWIYRFLRIFLLAFGAIAAWIVTYSFFDRKIHTSTGRAEWIWIEHDLPSREPVAFAAVRDFDPPESRRYAQLSIAAHPEYSVSLNGTVIGTGASGRAPDLDRYEIGSLLREGTNRLVIRMRSRDGVGGLLASLDYAPDRQNEEATPEGWRLTRNLAALEDGGDPAWEEPVIIGRPPVGPWNIPQPTEREVMGQVPEVVPPTGVEKRVLSIPEIAVLSGVAVVRERREAARIFDFGEIVGRLRLIRSDRSKGEAILWRTAGDAADIETMAHPEAAVFAAGERHYDTPESRSFRYVIVYDPDVEARALMAPPG